jgi:drug/metabolite transporter (DMT)-like permease
MTWPVFCLIAVSVTLSALAQIAFKHGMSARAVQEAMSIGGTAVLAVAAVNVFVWLGLILYGLSVVLWLGVLARVDVGQAYPFVGLAFLLTMAFGVAFLGESWNAYRIAGTVLIIAGVALVARG